MPLIVYNYLEFNLKSIIVECIKSLFFFIYHLFDILVWFYYSPYHQYVCMIVYENNRSFLVKFDSNFYIIFEIIKIFFGWFVAEIIILSFCDLEKYTKYEIKKEL